jgi:hypothetical protein
MKKPAVLPVLAALEAAALALGGLFWFRMRPDLLVAYGVSSHAGSRGELPWATNLALSMWFAPTLLVAGAACVAAGLASRGKMKTRMSLASVGLVGTAFGLAFALVAAYAPAFGGLGPE